MNTISIIGGGATGVSLLLALIRKLQSNVYNEYTVINIFEPNELGPGLAYSVKSHDLILNTSAGFTSIIDKDRFNFYEWLKKNESTWKPMFPEIKYNLDSFLPRALCGMYIKETLRKTLNSIDQQTIKINHIKENVIDITYDDKKNKYFLSTKSKKYESDFCALCTGYGNGAPQSYSNFVGNKYYFSSPYLNHEEIQKISKTASVLIIGTRLTAIDTVILLRQHINLTIASRSGYLPAVRNRITANKAPHLNEKYQNEFFKKQKHNMTLKIMHDEIEKELSLLYGKKISLLDILVKKSIINQLASDIDQAGNNRVYWQDVIHSIMNFIDRAWRYLPLHEKKAFVREDIELIHRYVSAFPLSSSLIILDLIKKNCLTVKSGLIGVHNDGLGFVAEFKVNNHIKKIKYDYVVNATSPSKNFNLKRDGLYGNLRKNKLVTINNFNGLNVNNKFKIINYSKNKSLFAAGPIINGSVLISNLLLASAQQCEIIAGCIINKMKQ